MEKQKEKKLAYKTLVELTKQSDPEVYFSRFKILEQIKEDIKKKMGCDIHYRAGYKTHQYKTWNNKVGTIKERIDLDNILPKVRTIPLALEELVNEGKAKKIMIVDQRWNDKTPYTFDKANAFFYRAILEKIN